MIIDHGPVIDAVEASIAIPFIARPVAHQGRYLLDGGFWDSAPVDAAAHIGADIVVAVELAIPTRCRSRYAGPRPGWPAPLAGIARRRTLAGLPFTIGAMAREPVPGRTADIVLRPAITQHNGNSPFRMVQCLEAGAEAAVRRSPRSALLAGEPLPALAPAYAPRPAVQTESSHGVGTRIRVFAQPALPDAQRVSNRPRRVVALMCP